MSSRSLLRTTALRPILAPRMAATGVAARRFASTHADSNAHDVFPEEGFNAPFYSKIAIAAVAAFVLLRISPANNPATPASDDDQPYVTRWIQYNLTPSTGRWKDNNAHHLDLAVKAAEDKLLFQEAEAPKVRRIRYTGTFDQASPNAIPVGSQADLSELVIKSEKDDYAEAA